MGFLDSIKNALGKSEPEEDVTVSPSQMLREAGVDPSGLDMSFGSDGSITVSGEIDDESVRQAVLDTLAGAPGIDRVDDQMTVAVREVEVEAGEAVGADAPAAGPEVVDEVETEAAEPQQAETGQTYTVESGDTLWAISEKLYGNGSKYMKIFEANTDILEHPDRIFPGQELKIPDLGD